jgi:hypothetical protein
VENDTAHGHEKLIRMKLPASLSESTPAEQEVLIHFTAVRTLDLYPVSSKLVAAEAGRWRQRTSCTMALNKAVVDSRPVRNIELKLTRNMDYQSRRTTQQTFLPVVSME